MHVVPALVSNFYQMALGHEPIPEAMQNKWYNKDTYAGASLPGSPHLSSIA